MAGLYCNSTRWWRVLIVIVALSVMSGSGLPVNKNEATSDKPPGIAMDSMEAQEYVRYLQELAKNDPG